MISEPENDAMKDSHTSQNVQISSPNLPEIHNKPYIFDRYFGIFGIVLGILCIYGGSKSLSSTNQTSILFGVLLIEGGIFIISIVPFALWNKDFYFVISFPFMIGLTLSLAYTFMLFAFGSLVNSLLKRTFEMQFLELEESVFYLLLTGGTIVSFCIGIGFGVRPFFKSKQKK